MTIYKIGNKQYTNACSIIDEIQELVSELNSTLKNSTVSTSLIKKHNNKIIEFLKVLKKMGNNMEDAMEEKNILLSYSDCYKCKQCGWLFVDLEKECCGGCGLKLTKLDGIWYGPNDLAGTIGKKK